MQKSSTSLFARNDTFFGVCEGLGEDFGFNPNYLRLALGVLVLWNPMVVLAVYAIAALAVFGSRWAFPKTATANVGQAKSEPLVGANDSDANVTAIAA